jgi:hypothetical protein
MPRGKLCFRGPTLLWPRKRQLHAQKERLGVLLVCARNARRVTDFWRESCRTRLHSAEVDFVMILTNDSSMQTALWPDLYVEDDSGVRDTLRSRWRDLNEFAEQHGGLCPQCAVKDLLGVHQTRVSQLVRDGQLQQVNFLGVVWITGNSLVGYMTRTKSKGGRGRRNPRLWDELVVGGKTLVAVGAAAIPDRWVE